jgi:RNA polymerase sigma factor (sigma-70 family)
MTCLVLPNQTAHADDYVNGVSMDFWKIYDQHYNRVRKFILAYVKDEWVADDLIQETFIKVQKNLKSVKDPAKLSSWIFRIAYNLCHDHYRQAKRSSLNQRNIQQEIVSFKEAVVQKKLEQTQYPAGDSKLQRGCGPKKARAAADGAMCPGQDGSPAARLPLGAHPL